VGAQGAIEEAFRAQTGLTKVALTRAVFKFIINEPLPFDLVASTPFNELLDEILTLCRVRHRTPVELHTRQTIKNWLKKEASLAQASLHIFFKEYVHGGFFALTCDGKKAAQQHEPMIDIVMHCFFVASQKKEVQLVNVLLAVAHLRDKDTAGRVDVITKVVASYGLDMKKLVCLTADQGDEAVGKALASRVDSVSVFIADVPHYIDNILKRSGKRANLIASGKAKTAGKKFLFDKTRELVLGIHTHYKVYQLYSELHEKPEFFDKNTGKKVLKLQDYMDTRFLSAFHAGARVVENAEILKELGRQASAAKKGSSLAKFPTDLLPLDEMIDQWQQVRLVTCICVLCCLTQPQIGQFSAYFNDMIVMFSAEKYPRLGNLMLSIFMLRLQVAYYMDDTRIKAFSQPVRDFMNALREEMGESFRAYYENPLICAATATDVRMRDFDPMFCPATTGGDFDQGPDAAAS
jgi:hypothetical protein